ncbi:MAG: hypothetical protein ACTSWY_03355 [Promethearchaeota archaeon]
MSENQVSGENEENKEKFSMFDFIKFSMFDFTKINWKTVPSSEENVPVF